MNGARRHSWSRRSVDKDETSRRVAADAAPALNEQIDKGIRRYVVDRGLQPVSGDADVVKHLKQRQSYAGWVANFNEESDAAADYMRGAASALNPLPFGSPTHLGDADALYCDWAVGALDFSDVLIGLTQAVSDDQGRGAGRAARGAKAARSEEEVADPDQAGRTA